MPTAPYNSPANRRVPEGEFVVLVEKFLEKREPDATIPWPASETPKWAQNFSPRVIVDLGTGVGGFIRSVLVRLGQWGCLDNLKKIVLIEPDTSMLPGGETSLRNLLVQQTADALAVCQREPVLADVIVDPITIGDDRCEKIDVLESYGAVDLIVASHITYYFGDGSGMGLIRALSKRYLSPTGKIWCVIRKQQCPIYAIRKKMLLQWGLSEVKPFDYAEYFEAEVLPRLSHITLLDTGDKDYLADARFKDRKLAAHLLMWREILENEISTASYKQAISNLPDDGAWFSERHFILGGPDG